LARKLAAAVISVLLIAGPCMPADSAVGSTDQGSALRLLQSSCSAGTQVAQAVQGTVPDVSSPQPTASPSGAPAPPRAPSGPSQLYPPALPTATPGVTPPPVPTPTPVSTASAGPVFVQRVSPQPSASPNVSGAPSASPEPAETLGPNEFVVLSDTISGANKQGAPADLDGNVNVLYADGIVVGDHAHYDGVRYIDLTGHPYIRNRADDSILRAASIRFDTLTSKAMLIDGVGQTAQGVETGHLFYKARELTADKNGVTHGSRASFTTCERQRAGYHVEAKTLDIYPNDRAVARDAVLYLGGFAVFFLPIIVIPLTHIEGVSQRQTGFLPIIGYSQAEGFYVKARIGFAPSDTYYGYYRLDEETKLGLGIGYVAFFRRKDGKRAVDVNFYRFRSNQGQGDQNNLQINDAENFSRTLRAQFGVNYQGNYAPGVFLPPSYTITGSVVHTGQTESQSYTFNKYGEGSEQSSLDLGFIDQRTLSPAITQGVNVSYTSNTNAYAGSSTAIDSLHFNTLTHITTSGIDYDLTVDKTESDDPSGIDKLPELLIRPHGVLDPEFLLLPISAQIALGEYSEHQPQQVTLTQTIPGLATQRGQAQVTFGPVLAHFFGSDFNASVIATQDLYGTGDEKAQIQQNASFTTTLSNHIVNAITYSEQNSNGPQAEPFKTFDIIGGASHQASDVIRFFNGDIYTLTLQASTLFDRAAQPINYQLNLRPSLLSSLVLGGTWIPGPGNGFPLTNVQVITRVGRGSDIEFATNVDWKSRGRLESKNIYYRRIIGDCYELNLAYNQDLKQVTFNVLILAFPSHSASFGLATPTSILPGQLNFATGQ
jgi:lipopolysaccharide assembly outer membrane protein LptD (OstA)